MNAYIVQSQKISHTSKKYILDTEGERPRFCEDHGRFFSEIFLKVTRFRDLVKTLF